MASIIQVSQVSKKFIIAHEGKENYTALRDVISKKASSVFKKRKKNTQEEFWALKDINFDIQQGDRVGIVGRNGAGKSTLLKVLSRITAPTTGTIKINGRVASLLEVGTGFHPELTGRENIYLNGAILGMSRQEIKSKFDEIVAFAEVERFLDTPVKRYSSGMYVRLAFAVAAHLEPEVLIVDEVLAVGDAQFQKKCLGKMEDVSKNEGRTILFVSHNMGVVSQFCNLGIYLKAGQVVFNGGITETIQKYLADGNKSGVYEADISSGKDLYFSFIKTIDQTGDLSEHYQFNDNIILDIGIVINHYNHYAKLSCTLQGSNGEFLSTIVEDIGNLVDNSTQNLVRVQLKFKPSVVAPNQYAFRLALFIPGSTVYDLVEMVCPIKIHDNGTKMAIFEDINYGSFFWDYEVKKLKF